MSDNSSPPSQGAALPKKDDKRPITGSLRGSKRPSSNPQATSGGNPSPAPSTGNSAKPRPNNTGGKKSSASPSNPAARLAAGEAISRPSSADSHARSGSKDSRPRHGPRNSQSTSGKKPQTPTSTSSRSNSGGAGAKSDNAPDNSSGLSALQRVITDLKSIAVPANQQGGIPGNNTSANPSGVSPSFQPSGGLGLSETAPRHRKSASTGSGSQSYNPVHFATPAYSVQLGVMQEDAEDAYSHDSIDDVVYHDQPGFTQPAPAPPQRDRAATGQAPMGSFTAPRFQALAQQESGESIGPSGRPQLAPNFMFGGNRRKPSDDDGGFQFPQQHPDLVTSTFGTSPQRRQPSDVPTGVTPLMAEQIALQSQIEALQQQQQQLLQQQLANNQVMASAFSTQPMGGMRGGHRRIQSQAPMGMGMGHFGANFGPLPGANFGIGAVGVPPLDGQAGIGGSLPRGHGRRHSVNVINKNTSEGGQNLSPSFPLEGFDDNFHPPQAGGHSRQPSRADPTFRMNGSGTGAFADLAQAQAQLQSLQQFRAAAGGHHQKMPSFNFPNMLPNMVAANMMGLGGYNLLQQQQQQFQLQLQQQAQQPQRKSLFAPYLPQASLPPLLAAGKLVVGILRVNKRNRSDAYVATEVLDADIYICGSKDRNRALEGDIVAVELLDVDEVWGTKKEKEEKKRKKEENAAYDSKAAATKKNDKKKDDVEVEGQGLILFEDEEVTDEVKPQFAGHVVAVVERMPGQLFSGTLGLLRPSSAATKEKQEAERREREGIREEDEKKQPIERPKIVWFKPTDKRVPLIAIPTEQAPPDFVQNSEAYADRLFVACIKRHPISSLHPFGTLVEELGPIGDVEVETSALLKDCNFPTEEFAENVIKCIPPVPWTVPEREYETRRDLREERIFTIDPPRAKDLDDALSIKRNDDGTSDIGVHIADVSHFVKANTPLDRDARKRATSVYLVQRAVPMLPPTLSEELCSLNPGQERLAFSVIFTVTEDARVVNKWFGRTIIKSAAKLSYDEAQAVIEGKSLDASKLFAHTPSAVEEDIRLLDKFAKELRARRFENGCLRMEMNKLSFDLDANGAPIDCQNYTATDATATVEEFMLLANIAVAQQIAFHLPEQALLRRHEAPIERRIKAFVQRAGRMGFKIDASSAGALQESLAAIDGLEKRDILEFLCAKTMHGSKYFCAGMLDIAKYGHYALNIPLYTHFTSPIRRYADIIVHRQLESVLTPGTEPKFAMDRDSVAKVAQQCNVKKDSARLAQEQSNHLFLCLMISDLTQHYGPVIRQAKVVNVLDAAFDVLVPEFGIEKRVHVDQMPIENHVFDEHSYTLSIYWSDKDVISWLAEHSDDEHLKKVKQTAEQHAAKMEVASRSVHDESALFEEDETEDEDEVVLKRADGPAPEVAVTKTETSNQRLLSAAKVPPKFEGLRTLPAGHHVQDIKELMTVPVIVTADLTKSPPVVKVYSVNPFATEQRK